MTAIGETLRRERLRRNLDLGEISRELKISHKFLEAIEDERFGELPGGVFAKSFVRQYARLLGLDEEELAGEVYRTLEPSSSTPRFAEQARQPATAEIHVPRVEEWENVADGRFSRSSPLPALALVVVIMLVCSGVYAWWQRYPHLVPTHDVAVPAETTAQIPQTQVPSPQVSHPQTPSQEPAVQPPPVQPPPVQPPPASPVANSAESAQAQPPVQSTADRRAGAAPVPASTAPSGAESVSQATVPASNPGGAVQVAVTADEPVWVLARSDGKFSFSGTLEANQTRTVEGTETVLLRLGNAGGVSIKLNGKPVGMVGPKGQVRTVQFTSGGFQIVAPPKPSLPLEDIL